MKHTFTFCFLALFLANGIASAQKSVISAIAQGYLTGSCNNLFMSATIGQTITGTFSCGGYDVIVGFQQPVDPTTTPYQNIQWIEGLTLYPNPATDQLNLGGTLKPDLKEVTITICDLLGRQNKRFRLSVLKGTYQIRIDDLLPGMYLLSISSKYAGVQSLLFNKQ
ncbi:MAG: T9SS type A sorting domain-containing protein [Saprospiraceae bacterium]